MAETRQLRCGVRVALVAGVLCAAPGAAWAEDPVQFKIFDKVMLGKEKPGLQVDTRVDLEDVRLDVRRKSDGKRIRESSGPVEAFNDHVFRWSQPAGRHEYEGKIDVRFAGGGGGSVPLSFATVVIAPLKLSIDEKRYDLEKRELWIRASRPLAGVEATVVSVEGMELASGPARIEGNGVGAPARMQWPKPKGADEVLRIDIKGTDTDGFFAGLVVIPWHIDIHQQIEFDTGKATIRADQAPKLDETYGAIRNAMKKVGQRIEAQLYIAGYTDTVGDPASNQALSLRRAKSIARAMRSRGLKIPIYFQGFGESVLAVSTPDETDEPRNRRALYRLGGERPGISAATPKDDWRRLD